MKKILSFLILCMMIFVPTKLLAANIAKIGETNYETVVAAVNAAESGDVITILSDTSANNLTLKAGITLVVPEEVTFTLTGKSFAEAGAIVRNSGLIVVDDGVLDVSWLASSSSSGLVLGLPGTISVKDNGHLVLPTVWLTLWESGVGLWQPNGAYATHIFEGLETGGALTIANNNYVYEDDTWVGAFEVGTENYKTFTEALEAVPATGGTIKLLGNTVIPANTEIVGKTVDINLNGHNLSAIKKLFFINDSTVRFIGTGKLINIINHSVLKSSTPDTSVMELRGSTNLADRDYTNIFVGPNVTLEARVGIYIQHTNNLAYGVNVEVEGKINAVEDKQKGTVYTGAGIQTNGQIRNLENYPNVIMKSGSAIDSTGMGMYIAGNTNVLVDSAIISAVEAGIGMKAGDLTLKNAAIIVNGEDDTPTEGFSNGINASGATLQFEANSSYIGNMKINIDGGTYTSENGVTIYEYLASNIEDTAVKELNIKGGTFTSKETKPNILLSEELESKGVVKVTGGVFNSNPSKYVVAGYKNVINSNNKFEVSKVVVPEGTVTVSGTLTNGANATVQLTQGGVVLKTVKAEEGEYSFDKVAAGVYNILAINGANSVMRVIEVKKENITQDLTIPELGSVRLVIKGVDTPAVIVQGLETVSTNGDVKLDVSRQTPSATEEKAIENKVDDTKKDIMFLEINLLVDGDAVTETDGMVELLIPFNLKDNKDIELYRSHEGVVTKLTKLDSKPQALKDGTFYLDTVNNMIHVYSNKFSVYAVAYTDLNNPKTGDNIITYIVIGLLSVIAISGYGMYLKKKAYNK